MKTIILNFAFALSLSLGVFGQNSSDSINSYNGDEEQNNNRVQTLFNNDLSHGGYLGFTMGYSYVNGKDAIILGGRTAWIINHSLGFGLAGYGFANDMYIDGILSNEDVNMVGGYGGLLIEPIIGGKKPIHLSFPILLGVGGVAYTTGTYNDYFDNDVDYYYEDSDAFMVIEPGVEIELNVLQNMRFSFGASYRKVTDLNIVNTKSDALDGLSYAFSIKIGKF